MHTFDSLGPPPTPPHPPHRPIPQDDDPLLQWLRAADDAQSDAQLERLCQSAAAILSELSTLAVFPDVRSLMAYALLDNFASARGLELAELVSLCPDSAQRSLAGVDYLLRRAGARTPPPRRALALAIPGELWGDYPLASRTRMCDGVNSRVNTKAENRA